MVHCLITCSLYSSRRSPGYNVRGMAYTCKQGQEYLCKNLEVTYGIHVAIAATTS